jgi:hypothetical protein
MCKYNYIPIPCIVKAFYFAVAAFLLVCHGKQSRFENVLLIRYKSAYLSLHRRRNLLYGIRSVSSSQLLHQLHQVE